MPYIIDGHNLIPKMTGIDLDNVDDEQRLVEKLQAFARHSRKRVEVYFDKAPPGQARCHSYGMVTAFFVREGRTADTAILARLRGLGKDARNWTVVSSDREVQDGARSSGSRTVTSQAFAKDLGAVTSSPASLDKETQVALSDEEVAYWLKEFSDE